ncbi:MAG: hypothetical protein L7S67_08960 [Flavobacteriales bacterium]|nr:hypothetical protein [Flavobacteriales bacterium]
MSIQSTSMARTFVLNEHGSRGFQEVLRVFILLVLFLASLSLVAQYDGYKRNPDGSYAVGGAYDGYKRNADGSYAVGGAYDGYKRNPDGSYAVGGAYDGYKRNADGSYAVGGA